MPKLPVAWTLALALIPGPALASGAGYSNFTTNIAGEKRIVTCSDIEMKFWKGDPGAGIITTVRRDRTIALRTPGSAPMRVHAPDRGGIRVQPSSDGSASALVCMAAGAATEAAANGILERLVVRDAAGELSVTGPDAGDWAAYIVLSVPPDAALDLTATNGELSLRDVGGRFTLRTTNGPIAISGVTGVVDGETVNGPIQFRGHAGDVRLVAQNGPVGVVLDAPVWTGKGLDGRTTNGPIQITAPAGLRAGVRVEGSAHSPFQWLGSARPTREDWRRDHTIQLGDGPVVVRLSTVNGPVEVRAGRQQETRVRI